MVGETTHHGTRRGMWRGWWVLIGCVAFWLALSGLLWVSTGESASGQASVEALIEEAADAIGAIIVDEEAGIDPADLVEAAAGDSYLRVVDEGTRSHLDVALRRFKPAGGEGPVVWLSGVVHIGDASYYRRLQRHLDAVDVVLFEAVGRPGFAESGAGSDRVKRRRSWEAVRFVGVSAERVHRRTGRYPADPGSLRRAVAESHPMDAAWVRHAVNDAWGRPLQYTVENGSLHVASLGADGAIGGEGVDRDIPLSGQPPFDEAELESHEGLQVALAESLGLRFQLNAIQYDRDHFRHSDLTLDELGRVMAGEPIDRVLRGSGEGEGGLDPDDEVELDDGGPADPQLAALAGLLDGSSALGSIVKGAVRLLRLSPRLQTVVRLVMIETLGQLEGDLSEGKGLPPAMAELIKSLIRDRNEVVIRDLRSVIGGGDVASVSVFYGAGHMADLEKRLVAELNYVPDGQVWLSAFSADAAETGMTAEQIEGLRGMIRVQMRMMSGE